MGARLIAIAGCSASGKSSVAAGVIEALGHERASLFELDWYYRDISTRSEEYRENYNFDHPDALDGEFLSTNLVSLLGGQSVARPVYSYADQSRTFGDEMIESRPVIVCEGIHALVLPQLRARASLAVFVDAPLDVRFERRLKRDVERRGLREQLVRHQIENFVRPMEQRYVLPSRAFAHIVVNGLDPLDNSIGTIMEAI